MAFRQATKLKSRLRMALDGPAKSGKTYTALRAAHVLGKRIAVINTESGAIEKYLGESPDGIPFAFDIDELQDNSPTTYTSKIQEAGRLGYDVLIIDSLSHAWVGSGGALEIVDRASGSAGGSFANKDGWRKVTPMHNQMIEAILRSPCHVIVTMRTKMEYVLDEEVNPNTGARRTVPRKVGMKPIQREGMEYEFDIVGDMDRTHTITVDGSRCSAIDDAIVVKPGADFFRTIKGWLEEGVEPPAGTYTTDTAALKSTAEMAATEAASQQQANAAAQRRAELLAMSQQAAGQPATTEAATTTEAAPFDGGQAVAGSTSSNGHAATADVDTRTPLLLELAGLGAEIGRTAQQINDQCKEKFSGTGVRDLPIETLQKLIVAFRNVRDAAIADTASKNQPAA